MMSAMKFSVVLSYPADPDAVRAMLADPAFREEVCATSGSLRHEVTIKPAGEAMDVVVDQTLPADSIPSFARKIVGDEINVVQSEKWTGRDHADLDVGIPGKPGHLRGTVELAGNGDGTTETVTGEIKVHIPMVGGKLEKLIADLLEKALRNEERVGKRYLA